MKSVRRRSMIRCRRTTRSACRRPSAVRIASICPLVSARALARPFTYLADGLEKGSVVSVPFGRARRRGVVVELGDEAPPEIQPVAVEQVIGSVSPPLVDLALWLAEYYG